MQNYKDAQSDVALLQMMKESKPLSVSNSFKSKPTPYT